MKRYALLTAAAVLGTAATLFLLHRKPVKNEAYWQAISQYVYAYTQGDVGRTDPIRVRFVHAAVNATQIGQPVASGVFSLSPSVSGQAVWEDDRTILFRPAQPLPFGQHYDGTVRLKRIYPDVPAEAKVFDFHFKVRDLAYEVITDGISTDPTDAHWQYLSGRIRVNEAVSQDEVEKMLEARQSGRALLVSWTHQADGKTHDWKVEKVQRGPIRSAVQVSWNGDRKSVV